MVRTCNICCFTYGQKHRLLEVPYHSSPLSIMFFISNYLSQLSRISFTCRLLAPPIRAFMPDHVHTIVRRTTTKYHYLTAITEVNQH